MTLPVPTPISVPSIMQEGTVPRKKVQRVCFCGCRRLTKGGKFVPGHDSKLLSAILEAVGGIEALRKLAEDHVGRPIMPDDV